MKDEDRQQAENFIATYSGMWTKKYGQPIDLEFLRSEVSELVLDKMKEELRKDIDFLSVKQLLAVIIEINELLQLKKNED